MFLGSPVSKLWPRPVPATVKKCGAGMFGFQDRVDQSRPFGFVWRNSPQTNRGLTESRSEKTFAGETGRTAFDGHQTDVSFSAARFGEFDGDPLSVAGPLDISNHTRAQEKPQQVQVGFAHGARVSMLGELAASIAHEVNQPLAAIRINGETALRWLDRPQPNVTKARDMIVRMLADTNRAANIVTRVREMAARRPPQRTALSLHEVITDSVAFLQHEFQSHEISASLDLAPALPPVVGDRTQLQQVVVNLVMNAIQAVAEGGTTRIIGIRTVQPGPETVVCTVEDSGPGIDAAHLPQLFDSFFTTKETGMGMGLPISRSIIEAHDGRIFADNKSALGGARFSFVLPAEGAPERFSAFR